MIVIDPVSLGDAACTRPGTATYYDRNGAVQTAPADTLRVTYDPDNLNAAPYSIIEPGSTNWLNGSQDLTSGYWTLSGVGSGAGGLLIPDATTSYHYAYQPTVMVAGDSYTFWVDVQGKGLSSVGLGITGSTIVFFHLTGAGAVGSTGKDPSLEGALSGKIISKGGGIYRCCITLTRAPAISHGCYIYAAQGESHYFSGGGMDGIRVLRAQFEAGERATSYIPTTNAYIYRAVESLSPDAGLVFSNVQITEPDYSAEATYALGARVHDPVSHLTYESLVGANIGNALSDTTKWLKLDVTNRWKMFDQYNNTQTTCADEILVAISPRALAQGLYLGNLDANEVRVSVTDVSEGVVYSEVKSLVVENSRSSYFNWLFRRIQRKDYFITTTLPPYANALVTVSIRKLGGIAKCGMCAVGPRDEFGPSLLGLSTEGKDFSSTTFNADGTSNTIVRPYAKRLSVDVIVENDQIDYVQSRLFEYRQKPIVWIGGPYGAAAVFGRYGSFKNVIELQMQSKMALTIEGSV